MSDAPSDDLLAAELAFGFLDAAERSAAERRVRDDPAFASHVRWWRDRSAALLDGSGEAPPGTTWPAIARRLPANDAQGAGSSVRRWQAATALAAGVALVLGTTVILRKPVVPAPTIAQVAAPPLVAVLTAPDRTASVAVSYDATAHRIALAPSRLEVGDRDAELWVIPAGGKPVSLGVIAARRPTRREPAPQRRALLIPGVTLAISLEPVGGSPTGNPTGPVILTGTVAQS